MEFPRGFKTEAEEISRDLRSELGLTTHDRLDPAALAAHLLIPVMMVSQLPQSSARNWFLRGPGQSDFSAVTAYLTASKRFIVVNDAHSDGRQSNSICHELAHIVLGHTPDSPREGGRDRDWNPQQEREADWLGGSLLVPRDAAMASARRGLTNRAVAAQFGVSEALATMRMNATGARLVAARVSARQGQRR